MRRREDRQTIWQRRETIWEEREAIWEEREAIWQEREAIWEEREAIWEEREDDLNLTDVIQAVKVTERQIMKGNHNVGMNVSPGGC